jgi:hypothetical protein
MLCHRQDARHKVPIDRLVRVRRLYGRDNRRRDMVAQVSLKPTLQYYHFAFFAIPDYYDVSLANDPGQPRSPLHTSHLPQRLPQRATVSSLTLIPTISQ